MRECNFSEFEIAVMEKLLAGDDLVLSSLMQQFYLSLVKSREFTGVGFHLNFDVSKEAKGFVNTKSRFCFGDVGAILHMGDRDIETGYLLWITNGMLNFLEGYTYGDEKWPETFEKYNLYYFGDQRNINELKKIWEFS